jgi:filamentous hemagglutinin family protein
MTRIELIHPYYLVAGLFGAVAINAVIPGHYATAQVIPDNTLGSENSTVTPTTINGIPIELIKDGATRGQNLFHSFSDFNVSTGQRIYFNNPAGIINILSRVTGTNPSNINGILGVQGNANLFFLNPNGIVFGPNANLDVKGSFLATTASGIQMGEQGIFSAINPTAPGVLTVNPSALLFNQIAAQPIASQATLDVPTGQSLVLAGGAINLSGGGLLAPAGQIGLGGLAGPGSVGLTVAGNRFSLNVPDLQERSNVFLSGTGLNVSAGAVGDSGNIEIVASSLSLTNNSQLTATTLGQGNAGNININAQNTVAVDASTILSKVGDNGIGNGGTINLSASSLSIAKGGGISTGTRNQGDAGTITINVQDDIVLDGVVQDGPFKGLPSNISSEVERPEANGNGGTINLTTGSLSLTDGGSISTVTRGQGNAGKINIQVQSRVKLDEGNISSKVENQGIGNGGTINLSAGSLSLTKGGSISAGTRNQGDAGTITINVQDDIVLDGVVQDGPFKGLPSNISSEVERPEANGNGGTLNLSSGSLSLTNGGSISTVTRGQGNTGAINIWVQGRVELNKSSIANRPADLGIGNGNDGPINISAGSLLLTNGGSISTNTTGQGDAGKITINVRDDITIDGILTTSDGVFFSSISSVAASAAEGIKGNGGNIQITANSLSLRNGGRITARTFGQGKAGSIFLKIADSITIDSVGAADGRESGLFTGTSNSSFGGDAGNITIRANKLSSRNGRISANAERATGGQIFITAQDVILTDNSLIRTNVANGAGGGGDITIAANTFIALENSDILANANQGPGGNITITADIFAADLFANGGPTPSAENNFNTLRSNGRVDISASSRENVPGQISLPDLNLLERELEDLRVSFVSSEQIVSSSCINRQGRQENRFTVSGAGGLAQTPYEAMQLGYTADGVESEQTSSSQTAQPQIQSQSLPSKWQLGDRIQEASGIFKPANGRIVLGLATQTTPQDVKNLVCR